MPPSMEEWRAQKTAAMNHRTASSQSQFLMWIRTGAGVVAVSTLYRASYHVRAIDWYKMASADAALPPMGKISMIGIWVETVLYGMSGVIFIVYLLRLRRANRQVSSKWLQRTLRMVLMGL